MSKQPLPHQTQASALPAPTRGAKSRGTRPSPLPHRARGSHSRMEMTLLTRRQVRPEEQHSYTANTRAGGAAGGEGKMPPTQPRLCPAAQGQARSESWAGMWQGKGVLSNPSRQSHAGCLAGEAEVPSPRSIPLSATGTSLIALVMIFAGHPQGLEQNHLPAHVGRAQGLHCSSAAPLSPQPEQRGVPTQRHHLPQGPAAPMPCQAASRAL